MPSPKILVCDIETAPLQVLTWGIFDQQIGLNQIQEDWSILAFCAKWLEEDKLIYMDTGGRGPKKVRDDSKLLSVLWHLLDKADIVVTQNGMSFDIKKINARLLMEKYEPYSPIRVVDTLRVSRRHFGMTSNKLAWLSAHITDTPKSEHKKFPGFELWIECLKDNPAAWAEMKKYNEIDVLATEKLYLAQRPWISNHPNVRAYFGGEDSKDGAGGDGPGCPKCGSSKLHSRGTATSQQGVYTRYQCQGCGGWSRGKTQVTSLEQRKQLLSN